MEEIKPEPVDQRVRGVRCAELKAVMVLLFVVRLVVECANLTLTTKCETQSDASSPPPDLSLIRLLGGYFYKKTEKKTICILS